MRAYMLTMASCFKLPCCVIQATRSKPFYVDEGFTPAVDTPKADINNSAIDTN